MKRFRLKTKYIKSKDPSRKFGPPLNAWDKRYLVQKRFFLVFWRTVNIYMKKSVAEARVAFLEWY